MKLKPLDCAWASTYLGQVLVCTLLKDQCSVKILQCLYSLLWLFWKLPSQPKVTYLLVCSPEALPELRCPNPGQQSATQTERQRRGECSHFHSSSGFYLDLASMCNHLSVSCTSIEIDKVIPIGSYLIPGHWFCPEEWAGEFYWEAFLVILGFVLRHTEQNCCSIGGWGRMR